MITILLFADNKALASFSSANTAGLNWYLLWPSQLNQNYKTNSRNEHSVKNLKLFSTRRFDYIISHYHDNENKNIIIAVIYPKYILKPGSHITLTVPAVPAVVPVGRFFNGNTCPRYRR